MSFYDVTQLAGVVAFVTVILNILAALGLIKGTSKEQLANAVQTIVSIVLTLIGMFAPDFLNSVPILDGAADLLAQLGALVLVAIPIIVAFGNFIHDKLTKIPFVNKFLGYQLSA